MADKILFHPICKCRIDPRGHNHQLWATVEKGVYGRRPTLDLIIAQCINLIETENECPFAEPGELTENFQDLFHLLDVERTSVFSIWGHIQLQTLGIVGVQVVSTQPAFRQFRASICRFADRPTVDVREEHPQNSENRSLTIQFL